jgi:hypothetical protein
MQKSLPTRDAADKYMDEVETRAAALDAIGKLLGRTFARRGIGRDEAIIS